MSNKIYKIFYGVFPLIENGTKSGKEIVLIFNSPPDFKTISEILNHCMFEIKTFIIENNIMKIVEKDFVIRQQLLVKMTQAEREAFGYE